MKKVFAVLVLAGVTTLLASSCAQAWTVGPWHCVVRGYDATLLTPDWENEYVDVPYGMGFGQAVSSDQACALAVTEGELRGLSSVTCRRCLIGACPKPRPPRPPSTGGGSSDGDVCGGPGGSSANGAGGGGVGGGSGGGAVVSSSTTTGAGGAVTSGATGAGGA